MKISLIFLVYFVSLSYQQRWMPYHVPREFVYPSYFYQSNLYFHQSFDTFASFNPEVGDRSYAEGRFSNKLLFPDQFRFLTNLLSTTTVFKIVTSSTTVTTIKSCIGTALFAGDVGSKSTTSCVSRRLDVLEDLIEKSDITPSEMEPLVPTALAIEQRDSIIPEISSSVTVPNDESGVNRKSRFLKYVVTTTSTVTSYSFSVTVLTTSFALGNAAGVLLCVPNGYTAC